MLHLRSARAPVRTRFLFGRVPLQPGLFARVAPSGCHSFSPEKPIPPRRISSPSANRLRPGPNLVQRRDVPSSPEIDVSAGASALIRPGGAGVTGWAIVHSRVSAPDFPTLSNSPSFCGLC